MFEDAVTGYLMETYGDAAAAVVVRLYDAIYAREGYYLRLDKLTRAQLVRPFKSIGVDTLDAIVEAMVEYGVFDARTYAEHGVLTNRRVQETFLEATKRRNVDVDKLPFMLTKTPENATETPEEGDEKALKCVYVENSGVSAYINSEKTDIKYTGKPTVN